MSSVLTYESKIQRILDANWSKFNTLAERKGTIDIAEWAQYFAYDVVSELALGRSFGMVKTGSDVGGYITSVVGSFYFTSNLGHVPGQRAWLTSSIAQLPIRWFGTDSLKGNANFRKFVNDAVSDRYYAKTASDSADMLQHFIEAKAEDGSRADFETVRGEAAIVLGAGADTTSIGIRAVLAQILAHPDVYRRLQQEIDDFYALEIQDSEISYKQCQTLPFLQAVIKEAGRLHPSIVYQLPRYAPHEGLAIDDYFIPPNQIVGISPIAMNRSKAIYGEDANEFNPDRWLIDDVKFRYMDSHLATVRPVTFSLKVVFDGTTHLHWEEHCASGNE